MNRGRIFSLVLLALVVAGGGLLLHGCLGSSGEHTRIRVRYASMQAALRAGDTNTARLLFAPAHRSRADDNFGRLQMFARPLGLRSKISIKGSKAEVCPVRVLPIGMFGHTIEMIKVEGEWYFTGKIGIL